MDSLSLVVAVAIIAVILYLHYQSADSGKQGFTGAGSGAAVCEKVPLDVNPGLSPLDKIYTTEEVDPVVTGKLYAGACNKRNTYAQRTSLGDVYGLTEFSSAGIPGDVGIDVGPYGMAEYGGQQVGADDGMPKDWDLPETPLRYYKPASGDYYGKEGATADTYGLYALTEGDHDPEVGENY